MSEMGQPVASLANHLCEYIRAVASGKGSREHRARYIAAAIKSSGPDRYRWVGIYDVRDDTVSITAWSGPRAPAHPSFPIAQGLTGSAISHKATLLVNDVSVDARYLTAFGSTLSEIIVPVVMPEHGSVVGTIDVESELIGAFSPADQEMLEECARAILPLWMRRHAGR